VRKGIEKKGGGGAKKRKKTGERQLRVQKQTRGRSYQAEDPQRSLYGASDCETSRSLGLASLNINQDKTRAISEGGQWLTSKGKHKS